MLDQRLVASNGAACPVSPAQSDGQATTVDALTGGNPALLKDLQDDGLQAQDVVRLVPGVFLEVDAGGYYAVSIR